MATTEDDAKNAKREAEASGRYEQAMHGVQTVIAYRMQSMTDRSTTPKHLRVGVDSAMVNAEAVANLLIARGVFTKTEYIEALADAAENELTRQGAEFPGITFR